MLDVVRRVAVLAVLAVALAVGGASAAEAKGGKTSEALPEDLQVFVLGNTIFTLFHELGHALIDKLEIPVLGREEDAVDALAVLMMLPEEDDADAEAMVLAAADGHLLAYNQSEEDDEEAFWDEHSFDLQRYAAIHCLVFGSDPEGWAELAQVVEMPQEQQERCPGIYDQTQASWDVLLDEHYRGEGDTSGGKVKLRFKKPGDDIDRRLVDLLRKSQALKAAVDLVSELFVLPGDFEVVFESCGDVNAYYYAQTGNVSMCYELVGYFAELYENDDSEE